VSSSDRVAVPTNGHRPTLHDDALDSPQHDAAGSGHQAAEPESAEPRPAETTSSSPTMPTMTASQVVAGVGVLAAVALLLLGRRRGRG
jgi:hypothetical protein